MMRPVLLLSLILVTITPIAAEDSTLAEFRATYEKLRGEIEEKAVRDRVRLLERYGEAIDSIVAEARKRGDLDNILGARQEQARLRAENSVPAASDSTLPSSVRSARAGYHAALQKIETRRKRDTRRLTASCVARLDRLERQLTKQGKVDEAIAARNEKLRVQSIPAFKPPRQTDRVPQWLPSTVPGGQVTALPSELRRQLVLYLDFNAFHDGRFRDRSGRGHHGTLRDGKWVQYSRGSANGVLQADGGNMPVDLGDVLNDISFPITVACRVRFNRYPDTWPRPARLFSSDQAPPIAGFMVNVRRGQQLTCGWGDGESGGRSSRKTKLGPRLEGHGWMHIATVMGSEGDIHFFVNGEKTESTGTEGGGTGLVHSEQPAVIGSGLHGMMDDLMVWNRKLSDLDLKRLHNMADDRKGPATD